MHARNVIAFFVWVWPFLWLKLFPLVRYFMKRHSLALPASERWEYPEDAYSCLDFASPPYLSMGGQTLYQQG